jgi:beta-1,4-mannosyl-glycoprotein beta-1,4-N-acetylglucosaminyltransferase
MIYDCFTYAGEKEILDIRLNEMRDLDVIHVLVEATHTFTGKPRALRYVGEMGDRVKYIAVHDMPNNGNPWDNEKHQRNAIMRGLQGVGDNDIVIISDVDEIPKPSAISQWIPEFGFGAIQMDMYSYFLNCLQGRQSWNIAKIMPYSYLKDRSPESVRHSGFLKTIYEGGWHFTFQGGIDKMLEKFASFSHQEESTQRLANREVLEHKLSIGQSLWGQDIWEFVPIDDKFPNYIRANVEKFKHMIR